MTRSGVKMFGVDTVQDYISFCREAVEALKEEQDSVLRGFTAILALNHVPDWLRYKLTQSDGQSLGISDFSLEMSVKFFFEDQNNDLKLVRNIANGFKHLRRVHPTERIAGYGVGPYGVGPFGSPYLLIDLGEGYEPSERWCVGLDLCQRTLNWWEKTLSPVLNRGGC